MKHLIFILSAFLLLQCRGKLQTGADQLQNYQHLFKGKRLGIVANHTAVDASGRHIVDIFRKMPGVRVSALFGPEHGFRGSAADGQHIRDDSLSAIPVYSLYGASRMPSAEMLRDVDMLVFDIQDIGARYYTYIWSLSYVMDAAAALGIPLVVLDRPNPITAKYVQGAVNDTSSFVGRFPIAARHGMTVAELARMFKGEGWVADSLKLTLIPLKNYRRDLWYDQTGLPFIAPSPNMGSLEIATVYPGMCLIEGTNLSEGRGTDSPFLLSGAPWLNSARAARLLNDLQLPGVSFVDTAFTPVHIPGKAHHPKYEGQRCNGIYLKITDRQRFKPFSTALRLLLVVKKLHPETLSFRPKGFDRLAGSDHIRGVLEKGGDWKELLPLTRHGLQKFRQQRQKYLLY